MSNSLQSETQDILKAEQQRRAALVSGDATTLETLCGWLCLRPWQRPDRRARFIYGICRQHGQQVPVVRAEGPEDRSVRDAALVTGIVAANRAKGLAQNIVTQLWVNKNGGWQLKHYQNTKAAVT